MLLSSSALLLLLLLSNELNGIICEESFKPTPLERNANPFCGKAKVVCTGSHIDMMTLDRSPEKTSNLLAIASSRIFSPCTRICSRERRLHRRRRRRRGSGGDDGERTTMTAALPPHLLLLPKTHNAYILHNPINTQNPPSTKPSQLTRNLNLNLVTLATGAQILAPPSLEALTLRTLPKQRETERERERVVWQANT